MPVMTAGHLIFSLGMTTYIFIGIYHEEKDLVSYYGDLCRKYRARVPAIIPFSRGTGNTLSFVFRKAGFEDIREFRISDPIHFRNDDDASDAMLVGGPVALSWKNFSESTRKEVRHEYLDSLQNYKNGNGYDIPAEFVVVSGMKK